ncbi:MAG: ATP-binding protein [Candidatus Eisenbacteria bacterium]
MHLALRTRILLFTVLPIVALTVAGLVIVNRTIEQRTHQSIHDDLQRASAVLEDLLEARFDQLTVAGQVIVQDPRFFSVLTLPGGAADAQVRTTVGGTAASFNTITRADMFEVLDPEGHLIASAGGTASSAEGRRRVLAGADGAGTFATVLVNPDGSYQVTLNPVRIGGHTVGWLLLGDRIGHDLAVRLRTLTRSEVTFVSGAASTGSTLDQPEDRDAALTAVRDAGPHGAWNRDGAIIEVHAPGHTYLTLARELPHSESGAHQVYVMQRALDSETAFLREMQGRLAEIGIAALLLAMLAGWLISQRITAPVERLVRAAEAMERGDYGYPLESGGRDELGYLTSRFGDMRQQQHALVQNLEQVARLRSEFINVASHELRTPISVIRAYQELMVDGLMGAINDGQREGLQAMGRAVEKLSSIAENATRMTQLQGERMTLALGEHEVRSLVERAIADVRPGAGNRRVTVLASVAPDLGDIQVDGPRLTQAIAHLVANGVRFTPDGGHVWVEARGEADDLVVQVRDDGVGIPAERLPLLFETTSSMLDSLNHHSSSTLEYGSRGLGLGLPIARGVAEAHGGTLTAASQPGRGSTFTLRVPMRPVLQEAA